MRRWLNRLDGLGQRWDIRYEAWLERHIEPCVDLLIDLWPTLTIIGLGCVLAWALASR